MINSITEYESALRQLKELELRLERLHNENVGGGKGYTKAGVRKMIARIHEELAIYEASSDAAQIDG